MMQESKDTADQNSSGFAMNNTRFQQYNRNHPYEPLLIPSLTLANKTGSNQRFRNNLDKARGSFEQRNMINDSLFNSHMDYGPN